jgi:hypothetical protein
MYQLINYKPEKYSVMKIKNLLIVILLLIPTITFAGDIFGTISFDNGKPCVKSTIKITDNAGTVIKTLTTDESGYFSTKISQEGKYNLILEFNPEGNPQLPKQVVEAKVNSNATSTGYKFFIQKQKDNTWKLMTQK